MYNVSEAYKVAMSSAFRENIKARMSINEDVFDNDLIKTIKWNSGLIIDDAFEIGTASMATINITLANKDLALGYLFENKESKEEIGVTLPDGSIEYVPLGIFTFEKSKIKNDIEVQLSGVDRMHKFEVNYSSAVSYPATLLQIAQDICNQADVPLLTTSFINSDYVVNKKPEFKDNISCRKAIAMVAELAGGYARISRDGKLEIINVHCSLTDDNNYASDFSFVASDGLLINEGLSIDVSSTRDNYINFNNKELPQAIIDTVIVGDSKRGPGDNPIIIGTDNLFCEVPEAIIDKLYEVFKDFSYYPFTMSWQGNPAVDCGDKLIILGNNGSRFNTVATTRALYFNGGLSEDYEAVGKSTTEQDSTPEGDVTRQTKQNEKDIKDTNEQMVKNVEYLQQYADDAVSKLAGNKGGYIYIRRNEDNTPSEVYIMDTPDPATAKKCVRANKEGIAGSTNGINGPFNFSMLIDGTINAKMVATGAMLADRIHGGTLTLGGLDNINGTLIMVDKDDNEIGRWDSDGIHVSKGSLNGINLNVLSNLTIGDKVTVSQPYLKFAIAGHKDVSFISTDFYGMDSDESDMMFININSTGTNEDNTGRIIIAGHDPNTGGSSNVILQLNGELKVQKGIQTKVEWTVTLPPGTQTTVPHGLGYKPIVNLSGTIGAVMLSYQHVDDNNLAIGNYGSDEWSGSIYLW